MKLNWGSGIAIFYLLFMGILLYFVVKSTSHNNDLVLPKYYEADLNYQSHFDKLRNSSGNDLVNLEYLPDNQLLRLTFNEAKGLKGKIQFYRPSDSSKDFGSSIKLDSSNTMEINTRQMLVGRWTIKLDWKQGDQTFFKEIAIVI